jgi:hypothetical protein
MFDKKLYMEKYNREHYAQQRKWRKEHPEKRQAARERFKTRHPDYQKSQREKHRETINSTIARWKGQNKEKVHAENLVLSKPFAENCEICDSTINLVRHHPDYSEPMIYVTLCASCHGYIHQELAET